MNSVLNKWDLLKLNTTSLSMEDLESGWYKFHGTSSDSISVKDSKWYLVRVNEDTSGKLYTKMIIGVSSDIECLTYKWSFHSLSGEFYPIYFTGE
jgi:hypothetical protein